jgi:2-oxoglutarate ferredoxin oxidoreductase subunit beta
VACRCRGGSRTPAPGGGTKSTPFGSVDHPFNPIALALGAEATFVARTIDNDRQHLSQVLRQAAAHRGTAFIEIYQNCNVFNDGAFDALREKPQGAHNQIRLTHGEPIVFDEGARSVAVGENGRLVVANVDDVDAADIVTHDVHGRPSLAFALSQLARSPHDPTCIGVFREFERPVYGEAIFAQLDAATERLGKGDLDKLLHSGDTWTVS